MVTMGRSWACVVVAIFVGACAEDVGVTAAGAELRGEVVDTCDGSPLCEPDELLCNLTGTLCGYGPDMGTHPQGGLNGNPHYCGDPAFPCAKAEGDCDHSDQCEPGLWCIPNVGARFGFNEIHDICLPPTCANGLHDGDEVGVDCGGICGESEKARCEVATFTPPPIAFVKLDESTKAWAAAQPSRYDGLPIGPPSTRRFREILLRLHERLAVAKAQPRVLAYSLYFSPTAPAQDSPATNDLVAAIDASPFPIVVGVGLNSTAYDDRFYEGPMTYVGHMVSVRECVVGLNPLGCPALGRHVSPMELIPGVGMVTPHRISTAALAALLATERGLDEDTAMAQAAIYVDRIAITARVNAGAQPRPTIRAVPHVQAEDADIEVLLQDVLTNDAVRDALAGHAVNVAFVTSPETTRNDYLLNGTLIYGTVLEPWMTRRVFAAAAN